MIVDKDYSVWYQYENIFDTTCSERRQFDTEEEADEFIQNLLNDDGKRIWKIIKTGWTSYYPETEKEK